MGSELRDNIKYHYGEKRGRVDSNKIDSYSVNRDRIREEIILKYFIIRGKLRVIILNHY